MCSSLYPRRVSPSLPVMVIINGRLAFQRWFRTSRISESRCGTWMCRINLSGRAVQNESLCHPLDL
jgi:hypothetical protein